MKKLIWTCLTVLSVMGSFGQRYEIWAKSNQRNNTIKGNYGFSNDSVLMLYSNPSLFIPSKDIHFTWDDVTHLKIRNGSRNQTGMLAGAAVGGLAAFAHYQSLKNSDEAGPVEGMTMLFTVPLYPLLGIVAGYLATSKKTEIHLHGMSPMEKNQQMKSKMKRKERQTVKQ
ncbi:MAG: hypothetical protein K0B11_13765 [Mariniphaga sp.]|nr:hypothetical protein [Mariniphaga sp.]